MSEILSKVTYGLIGALLGQVIAELTRARRKMRLLMRSARLPIVVLTAKDSTVQIRTVGEYRVVNMSDLAIHLGQPHLLGYNLANRGFQFKIMPVLPSRAEDLFEEVSIAPNAELALLSDKTSTVHIERFDVRTIPVFLWLETLELVRIGSRQVFRHRSAFYRRTYESSASGEFWFHSTGYEMGARKARLLALPGKLILRYRTRRRARVPTEAKSRRFLG